MPSRRSWSAALGIALALQASGVSLAQGREPSRRRTERSSDSAIAEKLQKLYDAYASGKYDEARRRAADLLRSSLSPFEISRVEQVLANIDLSEGRCADARAHLQRALGSGGLNDQEADAARYQLVSLFRCDERWQDAIDAWKKWAESALTPPGAEAHYQLAVAYYGLGDLDGALEPAHRAVELSKQPREPYLELLLAILLARDAYAEAVPLLKKMLAVAPLKRENWVRLAAVDNQLGHTAEAAQALQIAYDAGLLTEDRDLRSLAQLLLQIDIPYRAARILSEAIEKQRVAPDAQLYELLAQAWVLAREYRRAIPPLTQAAELSDKGDVYLRLAQLHAQLDDWDGAASALRRALDKGRLDRPCDAYLLLGIARYHQGQPSEARISLQRSLECPASRDSAEYWIRVLDNEKVMSALR